MTTPVQTGNDSYDQAWRAILGAPQASANEAFRRDLAAQREVAARTAAAEQRRLDAERECQRRS
jgi:hypothetical protein